MGTVQDRRANPLPSAQVRLLDDFGRELVVAFNAATYEFSRLSPGEYILQCQVEGFEDEERRVLLVPGEERRTENLVLDEAWILTVNILAPDGQRIRECFRQADWFRPQAIAPHVSVEHPGRSLTPSLLRDQSVEGVARRIQGLDRVHIAVEPPVYVSVLLRNHVLATQLVEVEVPELTFTISPMDIEAMLGGIVFHLEDSYTKLPVTSANIHANTAVSTESSVRLDGEGRGEFKDLLPGLYEVTVSARRMALYTKLVQVEPGAIADLGVIRLAPGVVVEGRCMDEAGIPRHVVGGLVVLRELENGRYEPTDGAYSFVSEEDGRFAVGNLPPARYMVQVPCPGMTIPQELSDDDWTATPLLIDTRSGPVSEVVVSLHVQAHIVLRPTTSELAGVSYRVITRDGMSCAHGMFSPGLAKRMVSLAPGQYLLVLSRGRQKLAERPFDVEAGTTVFDVAL